MKFGSLGAVFLTVLILFAISLVVAACAPMTPVPITPQVVEKQVTQIVQQTRVVEATRLVERLVTVTPSPTPAHKGGTVVMSLAGDPMSLNGIVGNDNNSLTVLSLTQEPLVLGGDNWGQTMASNLADKWDVSKDGLTWTIYLRKDVKWTDGNSLNADDVIFTFQSIQDPKVQTGGFRDRFMEGDKPVKFEKVDDYTVKATLTKPNASFLTGIGVPILPKRAFQGQALNSATFNQKPVPGLGPFKFAEWKSGDSVTLEANATYYKGAPFLDKIVFKIIPNQDATVAALLSGDIDLAQLRSKDVAKFLGNPNFVIRAVPVDLMRGIVLNQAKPLFQDVRVRQALSLAIDRQAMIDSAEQGFGVPMDSPFNPTVSIYKAGRLTAPKQDIVQAKALLAQAGWVDTNNDGIVEKDGKPFKFTLQYAPAWTFFAPAAVQIQQWWKQIGVDVAVSLYDAANFNAQVLRSTNADKPYDAFVNGWGMFGADPDHYAAYYATATAAANPLNYGNKAVKDLFDKARATADDKDRAALYMQAEKLLWDDVVQIPLYYPQRIFAWNNRVVLDDAEIDTNRFPPFAAPEKIYLRSQR